MIFDEANDLSSRKEDAIDDDAEILEKEMKELNLKDKPNQNEEETKEDEQEKILEDDDLSKE